MAAMEWAQTQNVRRLDGVLEAQRKARELRRREAARQAQLDKEAEAQRALDEARDKDARQVEAMLVICEQAVRSFGIVAGVPTSAIRLFFETMYAGKRFDNELFCRVLKRGLEDKRLRHGKSFGKLDINTYLIYSQEAEAAEVSERVTNGC
jgi:hypothetical protein